MIAKGKVLRYNTNDGRIMAARCDRCYDAPADVYLQGWVVCNDCRPIMEANINKESK